MIRTRRPMASSAAKEGEDVDLIPHVRGDDTTAPALPPSTRRGIRDTTKFRLLLFLSVVFGLFTTISFIVYLVGPSAASRSTQHFAVVVLRTVIFPLLRPACLPTGEPPPNVSNIGFALTTMFLPRDGPKYWTRDMREMLRISEMNKLQYCSKHHYKYLNGTVWAERNYGHLLSKVRGAERGVWFKPLYIKALLHNKSWSPLDVIESRPRNKVDWILYLDVDAILINREFDLTRLLWGTTLDDALIISPDAASRVNAGVFLVRNNDLGKAIVDAWTSDFKAMTSMTDQAYLEQMFDGDGYLRRPYLLPGDKRRRPRMKVLRQCAMQSGGGLEGRPGRKWSWPYFEGTYGRGDFVVHFFGRPDKLEQMRQAAGGSLGFWSR